MYIIKANNNFEKKLLKIPNKEKYKIINKINLLSEDVNNINSRKLDIPWKIWNYYMGALSLKLRLIYKVEDNNIILFDIIKPDEINKVYNHLSDWN